MDNPEDLAKEMLTDAVSDTAAKVLETKIAVNLLNPVAVEVGQLLGDIAGMVRFYASDNMARIFTRWAEVRRGKPPLKPEEFKRVMPMLQMASMQSDEELQARWARLLEATATDARTLPSFAQSLSQITSEEARFLDDLWNHHVRMSGSDLSVRYRRSSEGASVLPRDSREMTNFYVKILEMKFGGTTEERIREELKNVRSTVEVMLADFERLGILEKKVVVQKPPFPGATFESPVETYFAFTSYGQRFMETISRESRSLPES